MTGRTIIALYPSFQPITMTGLDARMQSKKGRLFMRSGIARRKDVDLSALRIRPAEMDDADDMAAIYGHHVLHGTASFEETPPTGEDMASRLGAIKAGAYPWLVAQTDGHLTGYAYLGPHSARSGYRLTAEDSIYVAPQWTGCGIGGHLLAALLTNARETGRFATVVATIGDSENHASIELHRKAGFTHVGTAAGLGFKFGRFIDVVYMQLVLNGPVTPH